MAICTLNLRFTFVSAGECGRHHDSFVFKNSNMWRDVVSGNDKNYFNKPEFHLIGDSAFELHNHLLVPYPQPKTRELTAIEKNFNRQLSRGRACIENAYGFVKGRFRRLKYQIHADLSKAADTIMAACVLHNMCISNASDALFRHMLIPDMEEVTTVDVETFSVEPVIVVTGQQKRDLLAQALQG